MISPANGLLGMAGYELLVPLPPFPKNPLARLDRHESLWLAGILIKTLAASAWQKTW